MKKFFIFAVLFSFLLAAAVVCYGFKSFSNMSNGGSQMMNTSTLTNYGRKIIVSAKRTMNSVLDKFGINIQGGISKPTDRVEEELKGAADSLNTTINTLKQ